MVANASRFQRMPRDEFHAFLENIGKTSIDGQLVQASRTALITAFYRAYHTANENPKVFDDGMAAQLLTVDEYAFFEEMYYRRALRDTPKAAREPEQRQSMIRKTLRGGPAGSILGRARFAEDSLEAAVVAGIEQVVLLGAGLDTLALRRTDLLGHIRVIEVDLPGTQAVKRHRLAAAGMSLPPSLHFVPIDFAREDLSLALARSCFTPETPTFFSWFGVTYYLERDDVFKVFRSLSPAGAPRSLIAFDYLDSAAFNPDEATPQVQKLQDKVRLLGEPMKTGFHPEQLETALLDTGWKLQQDLSAKDLEKAYFQDCAEGLRPGQYLHVALAAILGKPAIQVT